VTLQTIIFISIFISWVHQKLFWMSVVALYDTAILAQKIKQYTAVLRSRSSKELHHLVGTGAVTRCGSGSEGSGSDNGIYHGQEFKMTQNVTL
jgi:hypothetical protein